MKLSDRELYVARIVSGSIRVNVANHRDEQVTILVKRPTRDQIYIAHEVYREQLREAELAGLFSDDELYDYLIENEFWIEEQDDLLAKLPKEIEQFKVKLFKSTFKSNEKKIIRRALDVARKKLAEVEHDRSSHDHYSCAGTAALARSRYLIGCSLYANGHPVFTSEDFWDQDNVLLDNVLVALAAERLEESQIRELARTEPWRSTWSCRKSENSLFGVAAADYTDEQRTLVVWSNLYDNIYEHPDSPSDDIIADDDCLDGWLIDQREKREKRLGEKAGEELINNEKVRNAQEVFLIADTSEDAKKVMDLNDEGARRTQKKRFQTLQKKGTVNELDMPDTRQRLMAAAHAKFAQTVTGRPPA